MPLATASGVEVGRGVGVGDAGTVGVGSGRMSDVATASKSDVVSASGTGGVIVARGVAVTTHGVAVLVAVAVGGGGGAIAASGFQPGLRLRNHQPTAASTSTNTSATTHGAHAFPVCSSISSTSSGR